MKIETKIRTIQDEAGNSKSELIILNNTAHPDRVILKIEGIFEIQVNAKELAKAIQNATNI